MRELDLLGVQVIGQDKTGIELPDDTSSYRNENNSHQLDRELSAHAEIISEVKRVKSA
jgi:hypothetical protein